METRKLGIILIAIGLALFAWQVPGLPREIALLGLGMLGLYVYWQLHRSTAVLVGSLLALGLAAHRLLDISSWLLLALFASVFLLFWLVQDRKRGSHGSLVAAVALALLSLIAAGQFNAVLGLLRWQSAWAPVLVGLGFAAAYTYSRQLGFLIPAAVLIAIGLVAAIPAHRFDSWMLFSALALAFAAVYLIHTRVRGRERGERIWPLFPAGGLLIFSIAVAVSEKSSPQWFLAAILGLPSLVLLTLYAYKRHLGLLIPGLMLASLATWFAINPEQLAWLMLMLSLSFLLILLLETRHNHGVVESWWPLVPAIVLLGNATLTWIPLWRGWLAENTYSLTPGLILIGVGILVLFGKKSK